MAFLDKLWSPGGMVLQLSNLLQQSQHRSFSYIWDKQEKNPPRFSEL